MNYHDSASFTHQGRRWTIYRRGPELTRPFYFRVTPPGARRRQINTRQCSKAAAIRTAKAEITRILQAPHAPAASRTVAEVVAEVKCAKASDGASQPYLDDLERRLSRFEEDFAPRPVDSFDTPELDDWLRELRIRQPGHDRAGEPVAAVTRNKFRAILSVFFAYAKSRRYIDGNPAASCVRVKERRAPIVVPSPAQVWSLLSSAPKPLLAYFAIRALAGLRRSEVERLDWGQVDIDARLIEVADPKNSIPRLVEMPGALAAWLGPSTRAAGPVAPGTAAIDAAQRGAHEHVEGWEAWPKKSLRHCWFSMHLAAFDNAAHTALQGGHLQAGLLFRKYRGIRTLEGTRITRELAQSYFRMYPDGIREVPKDAEEPRKVVNFA